MVKGISFNFGSNRKPRNGGKSKGSKPKKPRSSGNRSNAWRAYISNAPIPD
jgi:hypothetical protein